MILLFMVNQKYDLESNYENVLVIYRISRTFLNAYDILLLYLMIYGFLAFLKDF